MSVTLGFFPSVGVDGIDSLEIFFYNIAHHSNMLFFCTKNHKCFSPMMIQTQKLTSLAFALADGHKDQSKLTPDQRSQAIRCVL